jgi:hypothetical protein
MTNRFQDDHVYATMGAITIALALIWLALLAVWLVIVL